MILVFFPIAAFSLNICVCVCVFSLLDVFIALGSLWRPPERCKKKYGWWWMILATTRHQLLVYLSTLKSRTPFQSNCNSDFLFLVCFSFFEFEMCLATTWRETNGNRMLDVLIDVGARGSTHGGFVDASRNARLPFSRRPFANRPRRWPLRFLLCRIYRISGISIRCWRQFRQTILVRSGLVDGNPRRRCWRQPPRPRHAQ